MVPNRVKQKLPFVHRRMGIPPVLIPEPAGIWPFGIWPFDIVKRFLTAQMSVFMVFCGPHLPLAFQFVCAPGGGGSSPFLNKQFYERGNFKLFEKGFFLN